MLWGVLSGAHWQEAGPGGLPVLWSHDRFVVSQRRPGGVLGLAGGGRGGGKRWLVGPSRGLVGLAAPF